MISYTIFTCWEQTEEPKKIIALDSQFPSAALLEFDYPEKSVTFSTRILNFIHSTENVVKFRKLRLVSLIFK